jgi:hypothetical protein
MRNLEICKKREKTFLDLAILTEHEEICSVDIRVHQLNSDDKNMN